MKKTSKIKKMRFVIDVEFSGPTEDPPDNNDGYPLTSDARCMENWIEGSLFDPPDGLCFLGYSIKRGGVETTFGIKTLKVRTSDVELV